MKKLHCSIRFYSEWHCGSGLSRSADADQVPVTDHDRFPFVPGKTVKGLLRDAAQTLAETGHLRQESVNKIFGRGSRHGTTGGKTGLSDAKADGGEPEKSEEGDCFFSNAELSDAFKKHFGEKENGGLRPLLFRKIASTAIEPSGIAKEHSLRSVEVVAPLPLFFTIAHIPDEEVNTVKLCLGLVKRLGLGRSSGLGRCDFVPVSEEATG